jgi:hypothetical protein
MTKIINTEARQGGIQFSKKKKKKITVYTFFAINLIYHFWFYNLPRSLASSTRIISFNNDLGERFITLHTVRNSVDHASLWNTITMLVVGNRNGCFLFLHLENADV